MPFFNKFGGGSSRGFGFGKAMAPQSAPTSLSAVPSTTSVAISFTAPVSDGGATITNYEFNINGGSFTALSPADATSPITISGLTAGTSYTITLRAVNIVGSGPASTGLAFTTPLPAATSVEAFAGGGGASGDYWAFSATGYNGGGGGQSSFNAAASVSGGTTYTITIGGQSTSSTAALGTTVTAAGTTGRIGNGTGGTGGVSSAGSGTGGTSAAQTITGSSVGYGGGGGGGIRYGAGHGGSFGSGGAAGTSMGLGTGGGGSGGGGGGGSADANVYGGGAGGSGSSGRVVIAYPTSFREATTTGSPSYSTVSRAGYRVYIFTGSGSITF